MKLWNKVFVGIECDGWKIVILLILVKNFGIKFLCNGIFIVKSLYSFFDSVILLGYIIYNICCFCVV